MTRAATFIGFGEAGQAFAWPGVRAYDVKIRDSATRNAHRSACIAADALCAATPAEALTGARAILSLVTADQACRAAEAYAPFVEVGALWLDMNSVAPETKRAAAQTVAGAGGHYVDVAVMAPVHPARRAVPLLVAGPHAEAGVSFLREAGFTAVEFAGARIGDASAIKMIRSVMVKGIEALGAECLLAAHRAGVADAVLRSLDAGRKDQPWAARIDYNLERMLTHGLRRAAEMEEAAKTLVDLGVDPAMTRATVAWQHALGSMDIAAREGLAAKLDAIGRMGKERAA